MPSSRIYEPCRRVPQPPTRTARYRGHHLRRRHGGAARPAKNRGGVNGHHTCQLINYSLLQKHFVIKFDSGTSLLSMTKMLRIKIISRNVAVAKKQIKLYHFRKMCKLFTFSHISLQVLPNLTLYHQWGPMLLD